MKILQDYVLVLAHASDDCQMLKSSLEQLQCPTIVAHTPDQAMAKAGEAAPYLVILTGHQHWLSTWVNALRSVFASGSVTIVALTDSQSPSWLYQEENPGLDGFLVKPLSGDVLKSLVQSARARQTCHQAS